jgi:putative two-component system response regulator
MSSAQIDTLESLLSQSGRPSLGELKLALTRLSAEVNERVTRGSSSSYEFFVGAVEVLSKVKGMAHAEVRLSCLFDSGLFFYRSGFARAALQTSDLVERLARRSQSKPWIRRANTLAGIVQSEAGNIAEAVMYYSNALRLARELGEDDGEAVVLINLGSAFNYASLHHEAIKCLSRVPGLCTRPALSKYLGTAYCDMAQAYLALEDYSRGFDAIEKCLEVSPEPTDAAMYFSRTIREFTYVQLALELGKLARAREHAVACRTYSQWGSNTRCKTLAEIASGLCEIRGGDVERGLAALEKALVTSGEFIVSRIDVLGALVKAYDEVGRPERALECMKELLSFVRAAREQSIGALLALPDPLHHNHFAPGHMGDVRALELREAKLHARVAEHELVSSRLEMLERLAITADLKEESSGEHGYRVGKLSALLAHALGLDEELVRVIEAAARLHDIGKIGIPDRILMTSNKLKDAERHFMSSHAVIGAELLARSQIPQIQIAEQIARHHHEWWNGTGYPAKFSGKRIPLPARIVALADVFDALTHGRPFAPAWPIAAACTEILGRRGSQFDPDLTDVFLALVERLSAKHPNLDEFLGEASRNSAFLQARHRIHLMLEQERKNELQTTAAGNETRH